MPLTGKYLKYSPKITLEIFTLVWDKLSKTYKPHANGINYEYNNAFIINKGFLRIIDGNKFAVCYNKENLIETTVQEILGYDPFIKEFVLPEKWYIKCTPESKESLNKWTGFSWTYTYIYFDGKCKTWSNNFYDEYVEITFEQFKKYVLKETIEESKSEELLEEAKKRYPVGTKFKAARGPIPRNEYVVLPTSIFRKNNSAICIEDAGNGTIYYNGVWAEIISLSKFPNEGFCRTDSSELRNYLKNKFPNCTQKQWNKKYTIIAWNSTGYWYCEEKSSKPEYTFEQLEKFLYVKQAVHCTTQEEWEFVCTKTGKKALISNYVDYKSESVIRLDLSNAYGDVNWCKNANYQILSFQEWCDLNNYKNPIIKLPFEVGDKFIVKSRPDSWCTALGGEYPLNLQFPTKIHEVIKIKENSLGITIFDGTYGWAYYPELFEKVEDNCPFEINKWYEICLSNKFHHIFKFFSRDNDLIHLHNGVYDLNARTWKIASGFRINTLSSYKEVSLSEIQQYLPDNHPDKFKSSVEQFIGRTERCENKAVVEPIITAHAFVVSAFKGILNHITPFNSYKLQINQEEFSIDYSQKIQNKNKFNLKINYDE